MLSTINHLLSTINYRRLSIILSLFLLFSCQDEESLLQEGVGGLQIALQVNGEQPRYSGGKSTRTTEAGEAALGENTIHSVDYFIFSSATGGKVGYWRDFPTDDDGNKTTPQGESNLYVLYNNTTWATQGTVAAGDLLYAVVNWNSGATTNSDAQAITSLSELKAVTVSDEQIHLRQRTTGETAAATTLAGKPFLMDGCYTFTAADITQGKTGTVTATVNVKRAAAKVRVNIYRSADWPINGTINTDQITGALKNYATRTKLLADGNDPTDTTDDAGNSISGNGLQTAYATLATYPRTDLTDKTDYPAANYATSILFYSFANDWSSESTLNKETTLRIDVPYDDSSTSDVVERPHNYYKIVMMLGGKNKLERNKLYDIDVAIAYDGAEESDDPVVIEGPTIMVADWVEEPVNVQKTDPGEYLILSDYYVDIRNESQTAITFYSSDVVTVQVVGFTNESAKAGTEVASFNYPGQPLPDGGESSLENSVGTTPEVPGVYYVNKDNYRIDITNDKKGGNRTVNVDDYTAGSTTDTQRQPLESEEVFVTWPGNQATEGTISIYSRIPQNVTKRYITLKVTMPTASGTDMVRYAVIEQYPLEYIEAEEGLVSYMDKPILQNKEPWKTYSFTCSFPADYLYLGYDAASMEYGQVEKILVPDSIRTLLNGHVGTGCGSMRSKFFWSDKTWRDAEGLHTGRIYRIDDKYQSEKDSQVDDVPGVLDNGLSNNNRMYKVTITATSSKYTLSYPMMEAPTGSTHADSVNVFAVSTPENNDLLSPCFMIASQLGNSSPTAYWEVARDMCKNYVEVDRFTKQKYDDWRLPTRAELEIIKGYQLDNNVYDITMNKVLNADGDTNPQYWTAGENTYVKTTGAGSVMTQTFSALDTGDALTALAALGWNKARPDYYPNYWMLDENYNKVKNEDGYDIRTTTPYYYADGTPAYVYSTQTVEEKEYKYNEVSDYKTNIRIRCVRDVK
ncbi:MAG: hypothetical protein IJ511_05565 [Bacteroides sp.]|nr:hypothetical protein [Bacteroides sp.]